MMLYPSEDGFLTKLQETGSADFTTTASEDLLIAFKTVEEKADVLGIAIRILTRRHLAGQFRAVAR